MQHAAVDPRDEPEDDGVSGFALQASVMTAVKASLDDRPSSYGRNLQLLVADRHHIADCLAH